MDKIKLYQRLALVSGLVLIVLGHFAFGWVSFFVPFARASAVTWISSVSGNWNDPNNWSSGTVPTASDDVIIAPTVAGIVVTVPTSTTADFSTLTLDGTNVVSSSAVTVTELRLVGDIGTGGDITVRGTASSTTNFDPRVFADLSSTSTGNFTILRQYNFNTQVISGDLNIEYGGSLTNRPLGSTSNYDSHIYFEAENINIHSGGSVAATGYARANQQAAGSGPGPGIYGTGPNGSGGAHAGNGGKDLEGDLGGIGYCDFENPATPGSSGGGSVTGLSGPSGGHLELVARNDLVINGQVRSYGFSNPGGGGGGGSMVLSAHAISGNPQRVLAKGGNNVIASGPNGGGGGGGCVKIEYDTSTTIDENTIEFFGGKGYHQNGGAGTLFLHKADDSIRKLYAFSTTTASSTLKIAAETPQSATAHSFQTLTINTSSIYTIGSGKTLTLTDDHPFEGSSTSGTIKIENGGTLKIDTSAVIENITIELHAGGSIVDNATGLSSTLNLTIGSGAIFDMRDFTTSSQPFEVENFTIASGGMVTHGSHEGLGNTPTHMVNIRAEDVTIELGGSINVSGKGFAGGDSAGGDGYGPGGATYVLNEYSGGGHCGEGSMISSGGGIPYCDISNLSTLGSGGAAAEIVSSTTHGGYGGNGGGLVWLVASSTLTINGDIDASGEPGHYFTEATDPAGGGAGGAVKLIANVVTGTPNYISTAGGWMALEPCDLCEIADAAGGGGGGIFVSYTGSSNMTSSTVDIRAGGAGAWVAEDGIFDSAPLLRNISLKNSQPVFTGHVVVSSTEPTSPFGLQVRGDYAYIGSSLTSVSTGNTKGLYIADVSDPFSPVIISNIVSSSFGGSNFVLSGNYLYTINPFFHGTSSGVGSMQIIDISDPYNPSLRGFIASSTELYRVNNMVVSGNYAYIAGNNGSAASLSGLKVMDISDPDHPFFVGNLNDAVNLNSLNDIVIDGNYVYGVVAATNSLVVIDVSDPTNPVLVSSLRDDTKLLGVNTVRVAGKYAYVSSLSNDLFYIIDISDPLEPMVKGGLIGPLDGPLRMTVSGDYAYVPGFSGNSLYVVDVSDPESPNILHTITSTDSMSLKGIRNSAIADGYLYTVNGNNDANNFLSIFNIENPSLSFQAEDLDKTTLSVKAEYVPGVCTYSGTSYATFSTSTPTSTYGSISINNSAGDNRRIQNISTISNTNNVTTTWQTTTDIPGEEGDYCMFATPYDGVVSGNPSTSNITLDLASVSPSTPSLSFSSTPNSITVYWDEVPGASYYVLSTTASSSLVQTEDTTAVFSGLDSATAYSFQIKAVDSYGNSSSYSSLVQFSTLQNGGSSSPPPPPPVLSDSSSSSTPSSTPSNPSGLILINGGDIYTNSPIVTLSFNTAFTTAYILSDTTDFTGKGYVPIVSSTSYTLSSGDGEKRVYARFSNTYGIYDAYDVITLDTLPPSTPTLNTLSIPGLVQNAKGTYLRSTPSSTTPIRPTLSGTAEPYSTITITRSSGILLSAFHLASVDTFETMTDSHGDWTYTFPEAFGNTTYLLTIQAADPAGNFSPATQTSFNLTTTGAEPIEEPPLCTTDCAPIEEPPILPPCTTNCEPITTPTEPPCTTDCGGEPVTTPPDTTGDGGENTNTQNTSANGSSTETPNTTETEQTPTQQVISTITDSARVITDTVTTFFTEVGDAIQQIPGVASVTRVAGIAIEKTKEVINNPEVEQANETIAAPVIAAVAVVNVAAGGVPLLAQVMTYIRLIFSQPLLLLKRRKQKKWGVVFNAYTKQPVDLAVVRLIDKNTKRIIRTQVTDTKGRYFMNATAGVYAFEIIKEGFKMHTNQMLREDSVYPNVYHGEDLRVDENKFELSYNIPLEPIVEMKTTRHLLKEYAKTGVQKTTSMFGVVATIGSFIISPKPWITALLIVHLVLYLCIKRLSRKKIKGTFGVVRDSKTKKPLAKVLIRVFDATYNKLVDSTMTDNKGRYAVLVGPSTYYITAEKEEYVTGQSGIVDLSSEKTNGVGGVIAEVITLSSNWDSDQEVDNFEEKKEL